MQFSFFIEGWQSEPNQRTAVFTDIIKACEHLSLEELTLMRAHVDTCVDIKHPSTMCYDEWLWECQDMLTRDSTRTFDSYGEEEEWEKLHVKGLTPIQAIKMMSKM